MVVARLTAVLEGAGIATPLRKLSRIGRTAAWKARYQPLGAKRAFAAIPSGANLHLGCGDDRLPNRINIDTRATGATDIVANLSRPRFRSVDSVVSNAFFEHVYRNDRLPHLQAIREALSPDGWMLYLGLPDFREVARLYLEGQVGNVSPRFDLFEVYRCTHGDPEQEQAEGWWLGQLHKGLFDHEELNRLLSNAGFGSWIVGNYPYLGEPHPVNLCFYARIDGDASPERAIDACREFPRVLDPATISWAT